MEILFQDTVTKKINKLKKLAYELKLRFNLKQENSVLLAHIEFIEKEFHEISRLLPANYKTQSNLKRHIDFTKRYLKEGTPQYCASDINEICENDIDMFEESYFTSKNGFFNLGNYSENINELISDGHFDSAIRKSFISLTEFLKNHFKVKQDIDGRELVNHIFGKNGIINETITNEKKESLRDFLSGLYGLYRNEYAHKTKTPSWSETSSLIGMINLIIEDIKNNKYAR